MNYFDIEEKKNPCAYCPYGVEATDSIGHDYFQCELDDNPDNYAGAMCTTGGKDD